MKLMKKGIDSMFHRLNEKVSRIIASILKQAKIDFHFSKRVAFVRAFARVFDLFRIKWLSLHLYNIVNKILTNKLKADLQDLISEYKNFETESNSCYLQNAPIWVCWWQGLNNAPQLITRCIASIKKNKGEHDVIVVTKENIGNYVEVPEVILSCAEKGIMKLANLADYIRCALLAKYGGLWIDATVFCSQSIPDEYFHYQFFSLKSHRFSGLYVAGGRWTTFVLGGWKSSLLYSFVRDAFEVYWNKYDYCIDYFLIDLLFSIAYDEFDAVKKQIDLVPVNNMSRYALRDAMIAGMPAETIKELFASDTIFYKLSYKEPYKKATVDGKDSVYALLIEN